MAAEVCAGTSSTSDKERMEATVTAMNMIANGRRNVVCGEIPTAVNQFQEACKLLAKAYGETAKECAEAYFYYGQALLDLARMETGVLGNALQGVPDTDEDEENKSSDDQFEKGDSLPADERERLRDEIYEAMADPEEDQSKAKDVKKDVEPASGEIVEMAMDFEESKPATVPEGKVKESEEQDEAEKGEGEKEDENNQDVEKNSTVGKQDEETVDVEIEEDSAAQKDGEKEDSKPSSENDEKNDSEGMEEGEKESEKKSDKEKEQAEDKDAPENPKVEREEETKIIKSDNNDAEDKKETKIADGEKEQIKSDEKEKRVDDGDEQQDTKANGEEKKKESNEESESTEKETGTEEEEGDEEEGEETLDEGETSQDEKEPKEGEGYFILRDSNKLLSSLGFGTAVCETTEESPDDISNLQLAWEMLELAKVIYLKDDTKESKIKAAEAHLKLGEVSLETEQYEQAVEDFNQCLKIQKEYMEPEDRALAETYYQLGLAFGFNKQYDQAIESYKTAIKTIEDKIAIKPLSACQVGSRICGIPVVRWIDDKSCVSLVTTSFMLAKLTKFIEEKSSEKGKEPVDFDDPVTQAIQEVKDLKDILPDICTKIEDTEEEKRQVDELKAAAKEVIGFTSSSVSLGQTMETSSTPKSDVKVTDISHLIKRKRKPEEEEEAGEEVKELKKTRQEDGSGDATTKENGNEHALEKDQDVPMEEANPVEVTAS